MMSFTPSGLGLVLRIGGFSPAGSRRGGVRACGRADKPGRGWVQQVFAGARFTACPSDTLLLPSHELLFLLQFGIVVRRLIPISDLKVWLWQPGSNFRNVGGLAVFINDVWVRATLSITCTLQAIHVSQPQYRALVSPFNEF